MYTYKNNNHVQENERYGLFYSNFLLLWVPRRSGSLA
jgi:hypothetical protein